MPSCATTGLRRMLFGPSSVLARCHLAPQLVYAECCLGLHQFSQDAILRHNWPTQNAVWAFISSRKMPSCATTGLRRMLFGPSSVRARCHLAPQLAYAECCLGLHQFSQDAILRHNWPTQNAVWAVISSRKMPSCATTGLRRMLFGPSSVLARCHLAPQLVYAECCLGLHQFSQDAILRHNWPTQNAVWAVISSRKMPSCATTGLRRMLFGPSSVLARCHLAPQLVYAECCLGRHQFSQDAILRHNWPTQNAVWAVISSRKMPSCATTGLRRMLFGPSSVLARCHLAPQLAYAECCLGRHQFSQDAILRHNWPTQNAVWAFISSRKMPSCATTGLRRMLFGPSSVLARCHLAPQLAYAECCLCLHQFAQDAILRHNWSTQNAVWAFISSRKMPSCATTGLRRMLFGPSSVLARCHLAPQLAYAECCLCLHQFSQDAILRHNWPTQNAVCAFISSRKMP